MSFADDQAAFDAFGTDDPQPVNQLPPFQIITTDWTWFSLPDRVLDIQKTSCVEMGWRSVTVRKVRPAYGGYRYEYWGHL